MKADKLKAVFYSLLTGLIILSSGCSVISQQESSSDTLTDRSISGAVSLSSLSGASVHISTVDSPENYMIWVQNRATKQVFWVDLNSDGSFTLDIQTSDDLTNGENFIVCLIRRDPLEYAGTIIIGSASGESASTGLGINGDVDDLEITFDSGTMLGQVADIATDSDLAVDESLIARLNADGEPVGADNVGKGAESILDTLDENNTVDQDQDGLPDIFDAMNNGSILDNASESAGLDITAGTGGSLEQISMFNTLKVSQEDTAVISITDNASLVIEATPIDPSSIASIEAILRHSNYEDCTFDQLPNGMTAVDTWPAEGTLWSDDGYTLKHVLNMDGDDRWTAVMKINNNSYTAGNLVLIKVTLTDASVEYYWLTINFKFGNIPRDTSTWSHGGSGTRADPYIILDTGGRVFSWTAPIDENGNDLTDLEYYFELFYYDITESTIGDMERLTVGDDLYSDNTLITEAMVDQHVADGCVLIRMDIASGYDYGDNAANGLYFKRSSW